jgi:hypothetical protein
MISHHPAITHAVAHQHRAELHRQAERSRRSRHAARISPRRNPRGIHSIKWGSRPCPRAPTDAARDDVSHGNPERGNAIGPVRRALRATMVSRKIRLMKCPVNVR